MKQRRQRVVVGCLIFGFALLTAAHFFSLSREGSADFDALESEPYAFESKDDPGARELLEWAKYHDPATGKIPRNIREKELAFAATLPTKEAALARLEKSGQAAKVQTTTWSRRGPYNIGGRTRALGVDKRNPLIILAGGVSGGMWRSIDGGASWTKTTLPSQLHSVSCLVQDTRAGKENTWYYGTGELRGNSVARFTSYRGDGVYKSADNGQSWSLLSSTSTNSPQTFDVPWDYVWNLAIDPSNTSQDVLFAATIGGIMRSTDGGTSWTSVLGSAIDATGPRYTDVIVTSTGIVYAGMSSLNVNSQVGVAATNKGIWRSTNGTTWADITPAAWPTGDYTRIVLAVAPTNQNWLYVLAETPPSTTGVNGHSFFKYIYVSGTGTEASGGGVWDNRSLNLPSEPGPSGNPKFDSQGSYDLVVKVKPDDENCVFIGGTNLFRSTDGFSTTSNYKRIAGYASTADFTKWPNQHPDMHAIVFDPTDPKILLNGNDGGIYKTINDTSTTSASWLSVNNGYFNTQFYAIAIDHGRSANNIIIGGMQDNGTWFTNTTNSSTPWIEELGGDGSYCAIADGGTSYYVSSQNGNAYRWLLDDFGSFSGFTRIVPSGSTNYLFVNPFVLDPTNTNRMYFVESRFVGSADYGVLWRNSNLTQIPLGGNGTTAVNWTKLTNTQVNGVPITTLAASRATPMIRVYYGTSNGQVWRLDTADVSTSAAADIFTGKGFPTNAYVSCIAIDPANSGNAMVVFSNYSVQSLYYTVDAGASWTAVGGNLEATPDGPSCRWAAILPVGGMNTYFVGTSVGLYSTQTLNGALTVWSQEGASPIANVPIDMIDTRLSDGLVVVGTHGSGIFSANVVTSVQLVEARIPKEFTLLQNYPNPFNPSTTIRYTIPERTSVRLRIYNVEGREIATLVNEEQAPGTYEAKWNGRNAAGVAAASGVYYSRLESGDKVTMRKMILMK